MPNPESDIHPVDTVKELSEEERRAEALKTLGLGSFEEEMRGARIEEVNDCQAVAVLGGGIACRELFKEKRKTEQKQSFAEYKLTWPSYNKKEVDPKGFITGAKARLTAAKHLNQFLSNKPYFVPASGQMAPDGDKSHAKVGAGYLEKVSPKIEKNQIILEEYSDDTVSNFIEIIMIAWKKGWNKIAILSNDYHLPRAKGFAKCLQDESFMDLFLKYKKDEIYDRLSKAIARMNDNKYSIDGFFKFAASLKFIFVDAEDILRQKDSLHYTALFDKVRQSPAFQARIASDKKGYDDFKAGNYGKAQWLKLHQGTLIN
ncbi:MAG: YdcF family protein [Patescibacteria group bacterium]